MAIRFHCPRQDCRSDRCPAAQFYSCLSPEQDAMLGRERLARCHEPGQVVIHNDTPALAVLSIHSGQVRLTRHLSDGHRVVVGLRGPGNLLGVREVLCAMPYQISVETIEPSAVCAVPREAFLRAVRDSSELAMRLLGQLASDFLLTEDQLVSRAHASVAARSARLIIALTDGHPPDPATSHPDVVSMGREEMALLIGTTRETLSRTLGRFAEQGAVETTNGAIRILDHAKLYHLAEE